MNPILAKIVTLYGGIPKHYSYKEGWAMAKKTKYMVVYTNRGGVLPAVGTGVSGTIYDSEAAAVDVAKRNVSSYDGYVFRLATVVRIKPVPVEIEQISQCEDAED